MSGALLPPGSASPSSSIKLPHHGVSFGEAFWVWLRVAALSFGGPAGQIAVKHRIVVDEKRWIGEGRFLYALSYCNLLPGPEAQQLAIYIGWLMHGVRGGIMAGGLFVLPGLVSIMALSWIYAGWGHVGAIAALFYGLKSAVLAVVLQAVVRVGSRALKNRVMVGIAGIAFGLIFFAGVPFPLIVISAGLLGWFGTRAGSAAFQIGGGHGGKHGKVLVDADSLLGEVTPAHAQPSVTRSMRIAATWLLLWLLPVAALLLILGSDSTFTQIALFFTQMAVVTFGGAYAVLAYVAQEAVQHYHWLQPGEMLDGLGMAETTPGPLIMVTQFVGFMAAYHDPGKLPPMLAGTLGGLLTTWVTFTPCFLWIFLGAPFIERLRGDKALSGALAAITAAVVGVILNLAVWFALHTWFRQTVPVRAARLGFDAPVPSSFDPWALAISAIALIAVFRFHIGMIRILLLSAAIGVVLHVAGLA